MPKQSGLGWTTLTVATNNLINDVTKLDVKTPRAMEDVTGLDKLAIERIPLLADLSIDLEGVFDPDASKSHVTFKDVGSSAAKAVVLTIAAKSLSPSVLFTDYALTRDQKGTFNWKAPGVLADGTVPAWT